MTGSNLGQKKKEYLDMGLLLHRMPFHRTQPEPEGAVQDEGGEEVSALHYETVGRVAAEVIT